MAIGEIAGGYLVKYIGRKLLIPFSDRRNGAGKAVSGTVIQSFKENRKQTVILKRSVSCLTDSLNRLGGRSVFLFIAVLILPKSCSESKEAKGNDEA